LSKYAVFRKCVVYVDLWDRVGDPSSSVISHQLKLISFDVRMFGGTVINEMTSGVTHVICDSSTRERNSDWQKMNHLRSLKFHLCSPDWIKDSITRGQMVDELAYLPLP